MQAQERRANAPADPCFSFVDGTNRGALNAESYREPNIPGIAGIRPPPAIFFIIFCISRN
jgi:hypothetical protein